MGGAAGEVLGLQRKASVFLHRHAALAGGRAVLQEIAGVELHAGLGGIDLHADAGLIAGSPGAQALAGTAAPVDDKAVVIAAAHHGGLGKAGVDFPADEFARSEVHGRVRHRQNGTGGTALIVAFQIAGSVDAQLLVQHIAAAVQIEVAVVGQVHDGVRVGRDAVIHAECIVLGEGIAHRDLQVAGESILAVGAFGFHEQGVAKGFDTVELAIEAAVQVVGAVVGFQLIGLAAHVEHGVLDAVGVPAHERAAAGTAGRFKVLDVIGVGVVAQHHIHRPALGGHPDILDDTAVVQHTDRQPAGVRDDVFIDLFAVWSHAKGLGEKLCHRARLLLYFLGTAHSLFYPLLF